jgi:sec-independent protein translocase protein TatB
MFDIGWTEIVVIAVVAILVVGPKDLPRMLRGFGQTLGQLRRTANEFKRQFDDALREAEREADLEDTRKQVKSISRMDPLADVKKGVEKDINAVKETRAAVAANRAPKAPSTKPDEAAGEGAAPADAEAAPAKAEAAEPAEARRDSDAA